MSVEILDIKDFIQNCSPMEKLATDDLERLSLSVEIIYQRHNSVIVPTDNTEPVIYLLRSGAIEVKSTKGELINRLDAGNWFAYNNLFNPNSTAERFNVIEDSLIYVVPFAIIKALTDKDETIKAFFSHPPARLHQAVLSYRGDTQTQLISSHIEDIKLRNSLTISPNTTILQTAQLMAKENRSAALITENNQIIGIITERDFYKRIVAKQIDNNQPISVVMTENPVIISRYTSASEAMLLMTHHNARHLPFIRENGTFSIITASDIIQFQSHNPLFLINDIKGALSVDELIQHSQKLPSLLTDLVRSSLSAYDIGHLISSIGEALNYKALSMAEKKLGTPPVSYAWVVAGSLGRKEQSALSDQDNALILSNDYNEAEHGDYFNALAQFVCDTLDACGYVYCPGNIMATNPEWKITQTKWLEKFTQWIKSPSPEALLNSTVFFDIRPIYGDYSLHNELMQQVLSLTPKTAPFLSNLAGNALQLAPPLGLFRSFVLEKKGAEKKALDLKIRGIAPITDLARVYALASGTAQLHTHDRIIAAAEAGTISQQAKADLVDAYEFIGSVRLKHQCSQIEKGIKPDNFVNPENLSSLEQRHLKDAFEVVADMQKFIRHRYL